MDQTHPHSAASLRGDLEQIGVRPGDVVLLHSSLRSVGFVAGGVQAVVQAFLDALGARGTLVVPAHTPENCDPAGWSNPPVPEPWWPIIRAQTPGFDPARTPSRWMGKVAETVRTWPGALRSNHPQVSFAAIGARAEEILRDHRLDDALGETSPLGAVNRLDGKVMLLGCGHDSNTSMHLAEWRQPEPPRAEQGASVLAADGSSLWTTWIDVVPDEDDFEVIGGDFTATGAVTAGRVGEGNAVLMRQRALVDFATAWMAVNRKKD